MSRYNFFVPRSKRELVQELKKYGIRGVSGLPAARVRAIYLNYRTRGFTTGFSPGHEPSRRGRC